MPSSVTGHKFGSEQLIPGFMNSAMWSYGMMPPWHQSVPAQQFAYPMPFPVVMPQLSAQHQWFAAPNTTPMENFTSLPPKAKQDNEAPPIPEAVKLTRRHSDPGPFAADKLSNKKKQADANDLRSSSPLEDDCDYSETQLFAEEANRDKIFSSLLQELRAARNLNRQLLLDLHKARMQLQILQQQPNDHQPPGTVAALVQKLYDAHHIRSDILSSWNNQPKDDSFGRRSSYTSSRFESDEHENSLLKQREVLINRLQATEKRIQYIRNTQWNGGAGGSHFYGHPSEFRPSSGVNSRSSAEAILSSSKMSRRHSFAMTSPSTSDPPSLDDIDVASAKQHGGMIGSGVPLSNLLLQPGRPLLEGRGYSNNNSAAAVEAVHQRALASTAIGEAALKRDLEQQLATVERDRRQLEHQLVETIGGRAHSEDRIIKLERLVSVLRKKLELQTSTSFTGSVANGSIVQPSPSSESSGTATGNTSATSTSDYATASYPLFMGKGASPSSGTDGPSSLPSYLQVVGPITQL